MDITCTRAMSEPVLLPLWIATHLHGGRTWTVPVDTGEVVGDRPWSVPEIAAAVLVALLLVGTIVAAVLGARSG